MDQLAADFIQFALARNVLRFGEFTLKSGRVSPYFFNLGLFSSGADLAQLGKFYAHKIHHLGVRFDAVFGPAYKGIPLASATVIALSQEMGLNIPYIFNRKEAKDHGEGGLWVGAPVTGRIILVDDVITAGTTVHEVVPQLQAAGAEVAAIVLALNREERGNAGISAVAEIEQRYQIPIHSLISLTDLINFFNDSRQSAVVERLRAYQAEYGA